MSTLLFLCSLLPSVEEPPAWLRFGPERIVVRPTGELGRRFYGDPETEIGRLLSLASAAERRHRDRGDEIPTWRLALIIARHLEARPLGEPPETPVLRTDMSDAEVLHCLQAFLTFVDLAHAATMGRVRLRYDVHLVDRPIVVPAGEEISWLPTSGEEVVDFIATGDYDGVIAYFEPGTLPIRQWGATQGGDFGPGGAPISGLALVPERETEEPDALALATLHEWLHQVEWIAQAQLGYAALPGSHDLAALGYRWKAGESWWLYRDQLRFYLPRDLWERASPRAWARHRAAGLRGGSQGLTLLDPHLPPLPDPVSPPAFENSLYEWDEVRDDPWGRLPRLDAEALREATGLNSLELETGVDSTALLVGGDASIDSPEVKAWSGETLVLDEGLRIQTSPTSSPRLDARLDWRHESVGWLRVADAEGDPRDIVWVRPDVADLFAERLAARDGVGVLGLLESDRRPAIVFRTSLVRKPQNVLEMLTHPVPDALGAGPRRELVAWTEGDGFEGRVIRGHDVRLHLSWQEAAAEVEPLEVRWWRRAPEAAPLEAEKGDALRVPGTWTLATTSDDPSGTWVLAGECRLPDRPAAFRPVSFELHDPVSVSLRPPPGRVLAGEASLAIDLESSLAVPVSGRWSVEMPEGWTSEAAEGEATLVPGERVTHQFTMRATEGGSSRWAELIVRFEPAGDALASESRARVLLANSGRLFERLFEPGEESVPQPPRSVLNGAGDYSLTWDVADPIEGSRSLRIDDGGGSRFGRVRLFGDADEPGIPATERLGYSVSDFPIVELAYRPHDRLGGLGLSLRVDGRWMTAPLSEAGRELAEAGGRRVIDEIETTFRGDGSQRARVDVAAALENCDWNGPGRVDRIDLGDPRPVLSNRWRGSPTGTFVVDELVIRRR